MAARKDLIYTVLRWIAVALGTYLAILVALKFLMPFIFALAAAMIIEPTVKRACEKLHFKRTFAAGICTVLLVVIVGVIIGVLIWRGAAEVGEFLDELPNAVTGISNSVGSMKLKLFAKIPPWIEKSLSSQLQSVSDKMGAYAVEMSGRMISFCTELAQNIPRIVIGVFTGIVALFFFSAHLPEVKTFITKVIPQKYHSGVWKLKTTAFTALGSWVKAELILSGVTFCQLAAGFWLLRVQYALIAALLTAIVDALPVLGSGMVLVPWALFKICTGETITGIGLAILYIIVLIVHNMLEPKLVSMKLGINPIAALASMYVGYTAIGVAGMILFPMAFMVLWQLYKGGRE